MSIKRVSKPNEAVGDRNKDIIETVVLKLKYYNEYLA